ncbi:nuclear transport factor 2 family protein [Nitratireductor luteus]|uniref:nuclear transport factor 2 family protein n=1 Tax=Nitratireductor luteus TaxID=2976980 RepID=UPI00223F3D9C
MTCHRWSLITPEVIDRFPLLWQDQTHRSHKSTATNVSSVAEATRAVVQEFLAARLDGDTGRLVALFADEVDWLLVENPAAAWIRPRSTAAECAGQFTELMEHTVPEDARASVDTFLVDGTDAILMGRVSGTVRATGKTFEGPFALRLTVEDGRITRHHVTIWVAGSRRTMMQRCGQCMSYDRRGWKKVIRLAQRNEQGAVVADLSKVLELLFPASCGEFVHLGILSQDLGETGFFYTATIAWGVSRCAS